MGIAFRELQHCNNRNMRLVFYSVSLFLVFVPAAAAAAPGVVHLFALQALVHAVGIKAACQDACTLLNIFHFHRGLHICFLCHSRVLLFLFDDYFLTVHNIQALRRLGHAAALQVVIIIN